MWRKCLAAAAIASLAILGANNSASAQAVARIVATCGTLSPFPPLNPGTTGQLYMDTTGKLCSTAVGGSSSFVWPGTAGNGLAGAAPPGGSTMPYVNSLDNIVSWAGLTLAAPTAPGVPASTGLVPTVNVANPGGSGNGTITAPLGAQTPAASVATTINGTLPAFAAPPTVNLGTPGQVATSANQTNGSEITRITSDGANTLFGAAVPGRVACPDGTTTCFGGTTSGGGVFSQDNSYSIPLNVVSVGSQIVGGTALPGAVNTATGGSVIKIYNRGPSTIHYQLGNSGVTASTVDPVIAPNSWDAVVTKPGQTNIAAVTAVGGLTSTMNVESGTGTPVATGGPINTSVFSAPLLAGVNWTNIGATDNSRLTTVIESTPPGTPATVDLLGVQGAPNASPIPVTSAVNVTPGDCSGTASTTAANVAGLGTANIHGFIIKNEDTTINLCMSLTGTAACAAPGSYTIVGYAQPGPNSFATPPGLGSNHAVSIKAASGNPIYTCSSW